MKSFTINYLLIVLLISMSKSIVEYNDINEPPQEFRAVRSSPWGGDEDLIRFNSIDEFKNNMIYIINNIKLSLTKKKFLFKIKI